MKLPFRLNDYNARVNPAAGAHDPGMMWDPVFRRYICYCTDAYGPALGVEDTIGIPARVSDDLVDFTYHGSVLSPAAVAQGRDNGRFPATRAFWAPYAEYVRGEYRLYYAATRAFGSSESRIWLAAARDPLGPFENRGVVADTWGTDDTLPNAIDPHVLWDGDRAYLIYGSFFGGIFLKELDPATGLPLDGQPKTLGKCVSRKSDPVVMDGPEGASCCFVPETGYYYLFQSYGWLGDTYDIRVGRSKYAAGPYLDRQGRDLAGQTLGEKLAGSFRFEADSPAHGEAVPGWSWGGLRGPGHGVPFFDPVRRAWFFVHHIRDGAAVNRHVEKDGRQSFRKFYMCVRPMFFVEGWPVLSPEPFGGQELTPQAPRAGSWELIHFKDRDNSQLSSRRVALEASAPLFDRSVVHLAPDLENGGACLCLTGVEDGRAVWGKYRGEI